METTMYLILTSEQELIAKGVLKNTSSDGMMQLKILGGKAETVARYQTLCLIGSEVKELPMRCRFVRQNDDVVFLKNIDSLSSELRRTFRVPVSFESFIYPVSGSWKGRHKVESVNISCGGIAFYCNSNLNVGEIVEIAIANLLWPILVKVRILRVDHEGSTPAMYASEFVDLEEVEEQAVCKAVFSVQMQERRNAISSDR